MFDNKVVLMTGGTGSFGKSTQRYYYLNISLKK
ncbi:hypothetical protein FNO222_1266 [Francisella orientalis]|uniref:Uncharacterized protein n=1 Tax=Francisella orientalis TaxID=299583 RepID=A0ABN5BDR5_9GAMM|nr:hypothetical protein FNO01_1254a [Francisella orientalis]ASV63836.1 hypothetical protein FNO12_1254a [Francisella orientalis FNO12]ASV63851.1 hypothetical protein FNO24_1256a [Francisella orientalis FNO24]ASV63870.1 hypothetical protein FNO190_1254a [Francisella orientalis]QEN20594.1 hypothetical protein FNO39_1266 [Francisella orientalis]